MVVSNDCESHFLRGREVLAYPTTYLLCKAGIPGLHGHQHFIRLTDLRPVVSPPPLRPPPPAPPPPSPPPQPPPGEPMPSIKINDETSEEKEKQSDDSKNGDNAPCDDDDSKKKDDDDSESAEGNPFTPTPEEEKQGDDSKNGDNAPPSAHVPISVPFKAPPKCVVEGWKTTAVPKPRPALPKKSNLKVRRSNWL